jgi:hypothetical protein
MSRSKQHLVSGNSLLVEEEDLFDAFSPAKGSSLFLGKYSLSEVASVLRKRNFFRDAQKRDLWPLVYALDTSEYPVQRFQIYHREKTCRHLVVDLKIRAGRFKPKDQTKLAFPLPGFSYLIMEWLTLQNPLKRFSSGRIPLPGQKYPGLNLGSKVLELFVYLARINRNDGIMAFPAFFHNALLFSRGFHFLNPEKEAEVLAIRNSFPKIPFKNLAWIVHQNCLSEENGGIYSWSAEEQIYPLNKSLKAYFISREYRESVRRFQKKMRFSVDLDKFDKMKGEREREIRNAD